MVGVQEAMHTLELQDWPAPQPPQLNVPPQPSEMVPQFLPCAAQVVGAQTQTLAVHVSDEAQAPQLNVPPQPSEMVPQFLPWEAQLIVGVPAVALQMTSAALALQT